MFVGLGNLQHFSLNNNQLASLPAGIFVGLGNLERLDLGSNNIHSIEAGTFIHTTKLRRLELQYNSISTITADTFGNLLQLQTLRLDHNNINTFPVEALSNLNISVLSELRLDSNQLETLPPMAYDILASISTVNIDNNPWQCDCRMAPFRQRMSGSYPFENQTICAGPANLTGQLLRDVNPEDLICEETTQTLLMVALRQRDPTSLQGISNPASTSSGHDEIELQAFRTSAEVSNQSETSHPGTEGSSVRHIHEDPDTAVQDTTGEVNQSEGPHRGAGNRQSVDSTGYLILSPSLPPENQTGPQAAAQVESADAAAQHANSQMVAAAEDAEAGPQVTVHENVEESVDNQSQTAAAPGADSPHYYEPLRNPSSQQQHTYTSLMPHVKNQPVAIGFYSGTLTQKEELVGQT
ncbi:hypothetical protein Bbelb_120310 [Branchiostoma belcheri]|nr:hypothetical protein Bbelb_120310 [Branchiostoma belcheri]